MKPQRILVFQFTGRLVYPVGVCDLEYMCMFACGFRAWFATLYLWELKTEIIMYLCLWMLVHGMVTFAHSGSAVSVWAIRVSGIEAIYPPPPRQEWGIWLQGGGGVAGPCVIPVYPFFIVMGKTRLSLAFFWGVGGPGFTLKNCLHMWREILLLCCCILELLLAKVELFNVFYNTYKL